MARAALPLIGVLIGAVLTIAGQILVTWLDERKKRLAARANIVVAARLQADAFWTFQNYAARALHGGKWIDQPHLARYDVTRDEMRTMAAALPPESWKLYSSAVRAQSECLVASPIEQPTAKDLSLLLGAYIRTEQARIALNDVFDGEQYPHAIGQIILNPADISTVLENIYALKSSKSEWLKRLKGPVVPQADSPSSQSISPPSYK